MSATFSVSKGQTRSLKQAISDAEAFRDLFPAECAERWLFAGSVRRRRPTVGDVEHVIMPRFGDVPGNDLFAMPERKNLLWHHLDALVHSGVVAKHVYSSNDRTGAPVHRWGEKYRGVEFRGFNHEIFTADAHNWGPQLAIRTGPGEFSKRLVLGLQRHGWMNAGGYVRDKSKWRCAACGWTGSDPEWRPIAEAAASWGYVVHTRAPGRPDEAAARCPGCRHPDTRGLNMEVVSVPDERQYLRMCGLDWIEPERRA